jgi:hypothetical protein
MTAVVVKAVVINFQSSYGMNLKETVQFEHLGVDRRIILQRIFNTYGRRKWIGFIWLRRGQIPGCCAHSNEPSVSINCGEFLDYLKENQSVKNDCSM